MTYPVYVSNIKFDGFVTDKISLIMSTLKILTNLYAIRQKIRIKNTFASIVYSVLVVEKSCKSIKKLAWK